jgi:carbohydrate esterase-like sialic acid-specific acetylesterase
MKLYQIFTLCTLLTVTALYEQDKDAWKIPSRKRNFHVFLLMGQSNMSGFGKVLPEDQKSIPHIVKLPSDENLKWEPAAHPLHNRLKSDRFGLGLPFAIEYLKDKPGVVVGLIPMARGGAAIDNLQKGTPTYSEAIKKAKFAMTQGTLKGVLWHQGESDTVKQAKADSYEKKLHLLILDCRRDLENDQLPFIVGNLAEFYGTNKDHSSPDRVKRIDKVRRILRILPKKVANTGFVETTDCLSSDRHMVHFNRKSYIILGKRYAKAYAEIAKKAKLDVNDGK